MWRVFSCAALAGALTFGPAAGADDKKPAADSQQKHCQCATITKISPQQESITVKLHDKSGKEQEQTFQLGKDVEYRNSEGKTAKLNDFKVGDDIVITQNNGKVSEIKENDEATITKVDPKAGTVTLKMKGKDGKETEKVFHLTEDAEYIDNTGRVAALDVFRSGDQVLVIESEGRIKSLQKASGEKGSGSSTASKPKSSDNKSTNK